jgi:hypothetical protein
MVEIYRRFGPIYFFSLQGRRVSRESNQHHTLFADCFAYNFTLKMETVYYSKSW